MPVKFTTQRTLALLLSGKSRAAKKYAGKHVLVIQNRVIPLKDNKEEFWRDIKELKKKYGEMPVITFVPRTDISYIL
ncbi:MAG: DUF5678 domain-containing protein [candidate division WOR-3 bacterium]|nr:DUF5678 domain-containing protein [candidate division WOR-3 bacterium]